jgi:predicted kinase
MGYRAAYVVAEDNLRLGRFVIADCVNPIQITRDAWLSVATRAGVPALEIEVKCSNADEHRRRVENRRVDIADLKLPTWNDVMLREYEPWSRDHVTVDTAGVSIADCVAAIRRAMMKG